MCLMTEEKGTESEGNKSFIDNYCIQAKIPLAYSIWTQIPLVWN